MAFMKRDVNLGLFFLIVAAVILFSGFTVYYQTTLKNISSTYTKKVNDLELITKDLEVKRGLLSDTNVQLQLRKQKEEDLSKKYVDIRTERDQFESDKKKLQSDLTSSKGELAESLLKVSNLQDQLTETINALQETRVKLVNSESTVANLKSEINRLERKISCLKQTQGTSESC